MSLAWISTSNSSASGRTTTEAIQDITLGIGRQSKLILDNLGIIVKAEEAYQNFADTLGINKNELSDYGKQVAFSEAAMKALQERADKLGGELEETFAVRIQKAEKAMQDFKQQFGTQFLKAFFATIDEGSKNSVASLNSLNSVALEMSEIIGLLAGKGVNLLDGFATGLMGTRDALNQMRLASQDGVFTISDMKDIITGTIDKYVNWDENIKKTADSMLNITQASNNFNTAGQRVFMTMSQVIAATKVDSEVTRDLTKDKDKFIKKTEESSKALEKELMLLERRNAILGRTIGAGRGAITAQEAENLRTGALTEIVRPDGTVVTGQEGFNQASIAAMGGRAGQGTNNFINVQVDSEPISTAQSTQNSLNSTA